MRYECNFLCSCAANSPRFGNDKFFGRKDFEPCGNQRLLQGITHDLVVFKTSDGRGWGLKTGKNQSIEKVSDRSE